MKHKPIDSCLMGLLTNEEWDKTLLIYIGWVGIKSLENFYCYEVITDDDWDKDYWKSNG